MQANRPIKLQSCTGFSLIHVNFFSIALADDIPKICETGKVHSLKINADEKNSYRSNGDYEVGQLILLINNMNVKVERLN